MRTYEVKPLNKLNILNVNYLEVAKKHRGPPRLRPALKHAAL